MRLYLLITLCCLLLAGCNPCKQAQRALRKCQAAAADTLYLDRIDTLYTQTHTTDTAFSVAFDTLLVDSGKVQVQLIRRDSTIYLRAICKPDTIYHKGQDRIITRHLPGKEPRKILRYSAYLLWALIAAILLLYLIRKISNRIL